MRSIMKVGGALLAFNNGVLTATLVAGAAAPQPSKTFLNKKRALQDYGAEQSVAQEAGDAPTGDRPVTTEGRQQRERPQQQGEQRERPERPEGQQRPEGQEGERPARPEGDEDDNDCPPEGAEDAEEGSEGPAAANGGAAGGYNGATGGATAASGGAAAGGYRKTRRAQDYGGEDDGQDAPAPGAGADMAEMARGGARPNGKPRPKNGGGRGCRGGRRPGQNGNEGGYNMGNGGNGDNQAGLCATRPCQAAGFGDVGATVVGGTVSSSGRTIPVGENIYSPFEIAFGDQMNTFLESLGCTSGADGHFPEGIDTVTAQALVAHQCGITLPRTEGANYLALMDNCGGHTDAYHFHESMSCLYDASGNALGHSVALAQELVSAVPDAAKRLYGKFENGSVLPLLDACNGHFGVTPDSNGESVYHYHVTDRAPFTFGCYGPDAAMINGQRTEILMSVEKCRAMYPECGNGDELSLELGAGNEIAYDPWCPCFDADGSNTGTAALAVFAAGPTVTSTGVTSSTDVVVAIEPSSTQNQEAGMGNNGYNGGNTNTDYAAGAGNGNGYNGGEQPEGAQNADGKSRPKSKAGANAGNNANTGANAGQEAPDAINQGVDIVVPLQGGQQSTGAGLTGANSNVPASSGASQVAVVGLTSVAAVLGLLFF